MKTGFERGRKVGARFVFAALALVALGSPTFGQTAPQKPEMQQKSANQQTQQNPPAKPQPSQNDANPFPENTTDVPVIGNSSKEPVPSEASAPPRMPAYDFDPVRSPDEPIGEPAGDTEQGFSSSSAGLNLPTSADIPDSETDTGKHRRKQKEPESTHVETAQEHESVGEYYLGQKNWRAALSRYQSALVLDPENPDVYWGLAESQRHLGDLAQARRNYQKVMEYDPDSKHAKEARKLLASPEMAHAEAAPQQH